MQPKLKPIVKPGQFSTEMYLISLEQKKDIEERLDNYQKKIKELTEELKGVDELLEFLKTRISADSIPTYTSFGKTAKVDLDKYEEYSNHLTWSGKIKYIIDSSKTALSTDELYDEVAKYEGEEEADPLLRKRIRNALWSLEKSKKVYKITSGPNSGKYESDLF